MSRGAPYDEAHDQDGSPRPQYAELLGSLGAPGELADEVKRRLRAALLTAVLDALESAETGSRIDLIVDGACVRVGDAEVWRS